MTHFTRTGFAVRLCAALAVGICLLYVGSDRLFAGKPAPPPPAGTIYYRQNLTQITGMNADGSGKFEALPSTALKDLTPGYSILAMPSDHLTSGSRWWITYAQTGTYATWISTNGETYTDFPHHDLIAVRRTPANATQLDVVQLTDLYGVLALVPQSGVWSNDSNEESNSSFVGGGVYDLRGAIDDAGTLDFRLVISMTLRLPVTASEIASGMVPPLDGTLTDAEIDSFLWPVLPNRILNRQGTTSPSGILSAVLPSPGNVLEVVDAEFPDYNNPVQVLWDSNVGSPLAMERPQWSPDGLTIAFAADDGNIWTVPANGSAAPKKVLARSVKGQMTLKYSLPIWSPDSQYLVVSLKTYSGTSLASSGLVRLPAAGGTTTDLGASSIGALTPNYPLRWTPSN